MERYEIIKYFGGRRIHPSIYIIVTASLLFLIFGFAEEYILSAIFLLPLIAGFVWYITTKADSPDKKLDSYCDSLTDEFLAEKNRFYANSGIAISDRFSAGRYCFENIFTQRKSVKGRDGIWRSSIFETECFFISGDTLFRNVRKVSLVSDEKVETSSEIPIKEISTISAEETNGASYAILSTSRENLRIKCPNAAALCAKLKMIKTELSKTGSE